MKPRVAVHKFASCDGCQLAFLTAGEDLLVLQQQVALLHFAEAGPVAPDEQVDIAFIEGSITTPHDVDRIRRIRSNTRYLVTIGACATAGGIQALRNYADTQQWVSAIYASPEYIETLAASTAIAEHVKVDYELWGCPVNTHQVLQLTRDLLNGVRPFASADKLCMECKRQHNVCVMVSEGKPCMGPVTRTGCGAICPRMGRDCYACYGPAENPNPDALGMRLAGLGLLPDAIARRFLSINNHTDVFRNAGRTWQNK